jgi:hypothetical protein
MIVFLDDATTGWRRGTRDQRKFRLREDDSNNSAVVHYHGRRQKPEQKSSLGRWKNSTSNQYQCRCAHEPVDSSGTQAKRGHFYSLLYTRTGTVTAIHSEGKCTARTL